MAHPSFETRADRDRHIARRWVIGVLALISVAVVAVCAGLPLLWLSALDPEFDGKRDLQDGYELWKLKGHPRAIVDGGRHLGQQVVVPRGWGLDSKYEVEKYAKAGHLIIGRLTGGFDTRYFIIDTRIDAATEFDTQGEWEKALTSKGINIDQIQLKW